MTDILSMTPAEISTLLSDMGQPAYRGEQIFSWLHQKNINEFGAMKNLPLSLREKLEESCSITRLTTVEKHISRKDGTRKYLSLLKTGITEDTYIESVLMTYKHGASVCISTQAGCKMGCVFCASGQSGFQRNLTAGEYCAQVYAAIKDLEKQRLGNIVLMGCGEPLDNLQATLRFIELITHPKGVNIGQRNITISTCGLIPQIHELADKRLQVTLAISLHAPTDNIRQVLMPISASYPLKELIPACRRYAELTRRRITFEYALVKGLNTHPNQAKELAKLLHGLLCHVNLIPINKGPGDFAPASQGEIAAFGEVLSQSNIPVTIRRSLGGDIEGACGQLRTKNRGAKLVICHE